MCFLFCHNDHLNIPPLKLDYLLVGDILQLQYLVRTILFTVPVFQNFLG